MRKFIRLQGRLKNEDGQAIIIVGLAMSLFLIAAVGLGFDGAHLYSQRVAAQTAADAAAQAAMLSIFDGTNGTGTAAFTDTAGTNFNCGTSDAKSPCVYAARNGFGSTTADTVNVAFSATAPAGVTISPVATDPTSVVTVTVSRQVNTFFVRFAGPTASTAKAVAVAAIVLVENPTPLLVTHPSNSDVLDSNGNSTITICGGPTQSVQVNSSSTTAYTGGVKLDLSHAGPADVSGNCTAGTGADFGVFGGDTTNPNSAVSLGTTGHYRSPSPVVLDPFANVTQPADPNPSAVANPATTSVATGVDGCVSGPCTLYSPGHYVSDPSPKNETDLFKPGVYYLTQGITFKNVNGGGASNSAMCVGCAADPNTGTGLILFDTGTLSGGFVNSSGFAFQTGNNLWFTGPTLTTTDSSGHTIPAAPYYNIAIWEDRRAVAHTSQQFGQGNGCFQVTGTIYVTNTLATMTADATHYQGISYAGNPCSATAQEGDIVTGELHLSGNKAAITMNLFPYGFSPQREVALVQ